MAGRIITAATRYPSSARTAGTTKENKKILRSFLCLSFLNFFNLFSLIQTHLFKSTDYIRSLSMKMPAVTALHFQNLTGRFISSMLVI